MPQLAQALEPPRSFPGRAGSYLSRCHRSTARMGGERRDAPCSVCTTDVVYGISCASTHARLVGWAWRGNWVCPVPHGGSRCAGEANRRSAAEALRRPWRGDRRCSGREQRRALIRRGVSRPPGCRRRGQKRVDCWAPRAATPDPSWCRRTPSLTASTLSPVCRSGVTWY
jgi:hypothetical protein